MRYVLAFVLCAVACDAEFEQFEDSAELGVTVSKEPEDLVTITYVLTPEQAQRFAGIATYVWLDWYVANGWNYEGERTIGGEPVFGDRVLKDPLFEHLTLLAQEEVRQVVMPMSCRAIYNYGPL